MLKYEKTCLWHRIGGQLKFNGIWLGMEAPSRYTACPGLHVGMQWSPDSNPGGKCQSSSAWPLCFMACSMTTKSEDVPRASFPILYREPPAVSGLQADQTWGTLWWKRRLLLTKSSAGAGLWLATFYWSKLCTIQKGHSGESHETDGEDGPRVGDFSCGKWCISSSVVGFTSSESHPQTLPSSVWISLSVISRIHCFPWFPFLWSYLLWAKVALSRSLDECGKLHSSWLNKTLSGECVNFSPPLALFPSS